MREWKWTEVKGALHRVLRMLRLYRAFFRISLVADLEFRAHFISRIMVDVIWYVGQLMIFESLYQFTPTLGSWNLYQMRVFLGILFISDALYMILFSHNVEHFTEDVQKGQLDMLLSKPMSSQFLVSCRKISVAHFGSLLVSLVWLFWALLQLSHFAGEYFSWLRVLWLLLMIPCGLLLHYSMRFMLLTLNLIFVRAEYLQYLWYQFYRFSFRPDSLFPPNLRILILTAMPLAFVASVPSRMIFESPRFEFWGGALGLTLVFLYLSNRAWNWALRYYTSASS